MHKKATIICEEWGDYETPKGWMKLSAEDKNEEDTERLLINKKVPADFMKRKKMSVARPKWKMYNDEDITKKSIIKCTNLCSGACVIADDLIDFILTIWSDGSSCSRSSLNSLHVMKYASSLPILLYFSLLL